MHGVLIEYRSPPAGDRADLLCRVSDHDHHVASRSPAPTATSRRLTGVFRPSQHDLEAWLTDGTVSALCKSHACPPSLPFMAAIYIDLSPAAMLTLASLHAELKNHPL